MRALARENRGYVLTAAGWCAAKLGIRQFLDLGSGLPSSPDVHEVVRGAEPDGAGVVYVDRDECVASHFAAKLENEGPGLAAVRADVRNPKAVLEDPGLREVIDLAEPVCVVLGATLSEMPAETARQVVALYAEALVPASAFVITVASFRDAATGQRMSGLFKPAGSWRNHSREDVRSFFAAGGLGLSSWPPLPPCGNADAAICGGVGVKA